jgi:hypothetical protein
MHEALEALGITPQDILAAHTTEDVLLKKLLADSLLFNRAIYAFLEKHSADLIQNNLHELERAKLRDKLVPRRMPVKHEVRWSVNPPLLGSRYFLRAVCSTCHQSGFWDCEPCHLNAETSQCGSTIPPDVLDRYRREWAVPELVGNDEAKMYAVAQQAPPVTLSELRAKGKV